MIWLMLRKEKTNYIYKYIQPDIPCNKGEIDINLFGFLLTIGWKED